MNQDKVKKQRAGRVVGGWLLLILFALYAAGMTLFPHVHEDPVTGKIVVHSHPYSSGNSAKPGHSHSLGEFQFFQQLASQGFLAVTLGSAFFGMRFIREIARDTGSSLIRTDYTGKYFLRGPPALVFVN